jgi:hypothetical protein
MVGIEPNFFLFEGQVTQPFVFTRAMVATGLEPASAGLKDHCSTN